MPPLRGRGLCLLPEALTAFEASGRGDMLAEVYRLQGEVILRPCPGEEAMSATYKGGMTP
jgi:hypothetical protein